MFERALYPIINEMLDAFRIVYLTGPRQSGKTTLAQKIARGRRMDYVSLDDVSAREAAQVDPHGFLDAFRGPIVIDEFQYVPELVRAVKAVSDSLGVGTKGKFLLTGSTDIFKSARLSEALPGHMARLELWPLSQAELHRSLGVNLVDSLAEGSLPKSTRAVSRLDVAGWILTGGYPEPLGMTPRARQVWFKSYVEGRMLKDFEHLHSARGDYVTKLRGLIPYLAGRSGGLLKYASVSNDLDLNDGLVRQYIETLELMFILRRVPSWTKNPAKRQTVRMPKVHFVDTGLACHVLGLRSAKRLLASQNYGGLFESMVFGELYKASTWSDEVVGIHHFRDKRKHEVDFVLELVDGRIVGVEAKASASVKAEDFRGLHKLAELAGHRFKAGYVIYTGARVLSFGWSELKLLAVPLGLS